MPGRARRLRLPILSAIAVVACLYAFSPNFRFASGPVAGPYGGDFLQEWLGGWIVLHGDTSRFYDAEYAYHLQHDPQIVGFAWNEDEYLPIVYPPFYYLVISPLSFVPVHAAAWIWAGLMAAALAIALRLLATLVREPFSRRRHVDALSEHEKRSDGRLCALLPWLIPAAVLFVPALESLGSSQKGTLCLLVLSGTFMLWDRRRSFSAGMVFGLLAFKPQLVLVIAVAALWKRQWRFVAGGAITGAVLLALSLAVGVDVCEQYVRFAAGAGDYMSTAGYDLHKSHSVWGLAKLLSRPDSHVALLLGVVLAGVVIWQLATALRGRWVPGSQRFGGQFAALVVGTVLLCPHLFTYDLTILLLPMALVISQLASAHTNPKRQRGKTGGGESASLALRVGVANGARWLLPLTALLYIAPPFSTQLAAACGLQITVPLLIVYLRALARMTTATLRSERKIRADLGCAPRLASSP